MPPLLFHPSRCPQEQFALLGKDVVPRLNHDGEGNTRVGPAQKIPDHLLVFLIMKEGMIVGQRLAFYP